MFRKQLYRTALLSSIVMGIFSVSSYYFLFNANRDSGFITKVYVYSVLYVLLIWLLNIILIENKKIKTFKLVFLRHVLSFILSALFFTIYGYLYKTYFSKYFNMANQSFISGLINNIALDAMILLISDALIFHNKKQQTDKELADLKIKQLEAEQEKLIQQMQPHFLFNALSTLNSLISTDSSLAKKYLIKLSNFLRFTIHAHENALISLDEEMLFTQNYIDLQQMRFGDSFKCSVAVPKEIRNTYKIPVYALQTLVENAIKHNLFTEEYPLKINMTFLDEFIVISNNIRCKKKSIGISTGIGLKNLKKRYRMCTASDVIVEETPNEFTVILKLLK